jgi:AbrB family looped-hinge helix DNA binding protein
MTAMYSTLTSKGQVTLPARLRRELGFTPGDKVHFAVEDGRLVIEPPPPSFEAIQARAKAEAMANGTWGRSHEAGDGFRAHVQERHHAQP